MFLLKSVITWLNQDSQEPEPLPNQPILTLNVSSSIWYAQGLHCGSDYLFLTPRNRSPLVDLNGSNVKELIDRLLNHVGKEPMQLLKVNVLFASSNIREYIEEQLELRHISYFVTDDKIKSSDRLNYIPQPKQVTWRSFPVLFETIKGRYGSSFNITIGFFPGISKTYKSIVSPTEDLKIEVTRNYIKIEEPKAQIYAVYFPDEIFLELKFCSLLMTPSGTKWHDFLFRGLYDPRLLILIWAFASKI